MSGGYFIYHLVTANIRPAGREHFFLLGFRNKQRLLSCADMPATVL